MNKEIMMKLFPNEVKLIEEGRCPLCKNYFDINKFKDELSLKEFHISGLCPDCQDKLFESEDDL